MYIPMYIYIYIHIYIYIERERDRERERDFILHRRRALPTAPIRQTKK